MTLDPLAQIAVLDKAITVLEDDEELHLSKLERIPYVLGLLEGMKEMLEYSAGKCKPEDQF